MEVWYRVETEQYRNTIQKINKKLTKTKMKNEKSYNSFKFSLFAPSRLVFRESKPEKSNPPVQPKLRPGEVPGFFDELLSKEKPLGVLKQELERLKNPKSWPLLSPKEKGIVINGAERILNPKSLKPEPIRIKSFLTGKIKSFLTGFSGPSREILERIPKIPELNKLGKKLSEYAKNLPKEGKKFDLPGSISKLLIIREGNTVKVSKVEGILSDLTFKTDYYFDASSGKYLKGTFTSNDKGKISKHDESNPNELLKFVPPLIAEPFRINTAERILNTKSLGGMAKGEVPNR